MSRHRNIRSMNYNEEYDTYYDVYGQSVEEDCCISPRTAAEFMYDRTGQSHSMSAYLAEDEQEALPEEPEDQEESLSTFDQARLQSCLEEIQNIVGETVSEAELKQTVIQHEYDLAKALDAVLKKAEEPKPQRVRKERQRQEPSLSLCLSGQSSFLNSVWGSSEDQGTSTLSELLNHTNDSKPQSLSQLLGDFDLGSNGADSSKLLSDDLFSDSKDHSVSVDLFSMITGCGNSIELKSNDLWSGVCDDNLTLGQLADLCLPLQNDVLGLTHSEVSLSELAVTAKGLEEKGNKEDVIRNFAVVTHYLLNFPHDLYEVVEETAVLSDVVADLELGDRTNEWPSYLGCFMCLRPRHSKKLIVPPSLFLPTQFDFNSPSPDDITCSKRTNKETVVEKKEVELTATENNAELNPPAKPPDVNKEAASTVILIADKQTPVNRNTAQHLTVETQQGKSGSRNSSRSPSPAPNVATPTLPKRNVRGQDSSNPLDVYSKERSSQKPLINLVVIGHVDAGKSTLMGHLLFRLGCVSKKTMHKNEQDSKKMGKSSFMYAWVLDETPEERSRGITMDIAQSRFETPNRTVTLLDAPGHRDFIPNMITGAAQADNAILVVDGTRGEFEAGFEAGGQTREHTLLVRSLGVSQLAVAVNKMDNESWSEGRYKEIVAKMSVFLKQAGFKDSDVQFVPCSGLTGENLTRPLLEDNSQVTWYKGPCLLDIIDNFPAPVRPITLPFRLCIADIFKGQGSGFCVGGRVESGFVQNGDKVLIMPAGEQATVKGISQDETVNVQTAFAGDHVTLTLSGVDMNKVMSGDVVCDPQRPIPSSQRFRGRIVTFNLPVPLTQGCPVVLHYQSMSEQAILKKLISQLHKGTGQVIKKKPRCLPKNSSGVIELEVCRPICVELYKDNRDLGRFMLRAGGATVAAGLVTQVL